MKPGNNGQCQIEYDKGNQEDQETHKNFLSQQQEILPLHSPIVLQMKKYNKGSPNAVFMINHQSCGRQKTTLYPRMLNKL